MAEIGGPERLLLSERDAGTGNPSPGGEPYRREKSEADSPSSYLKHRSRAPRDGCRQPRGRDNDIFLRAEHRTESGTGSACRIEADRDAYAASEGALTQDTSSITCSERLARRIELRTERECLLEVLDEDPYLRRQPAACGSNREDRHDSFIRSQKTYNSTLSEFRGE
jgi:hypothetical protein